jgi:glutathione S-transferase
MLKIHGVPISVHTRKVIVTAIEKKLAYENEPVIPFNPPADWTQLSPTGRIPVLTDGDLSLPDSSVICAYLEREHPAHPIYPRDTRDYVQALWFEEYADGTMFRDLVHGLFFQKIIRPKILQQQTDATVIEGILGEAVPKIFGYLEGATPATYLAGGKFSIADVAVVSNLVNYHYLGYAIDAKRYPKLASYFTRLCRHPSVAAALAAEQPVAESMGLDRAFLGSRVPELA